MSLTPSESLKAAVSGLRAGNAPADPQAFAETLATWLETTDAVYYRMLAAVAAGERKDPTAVQPMSDLGHALAIARTYLGENAPVESYLVWSHEHGAWWGANGCNYTQDVWRAGRYDEAAAQEASHRRPWGTSSLPPEVMVAAPEAGRGPFAADEISSIPELMEVRVEQATEQRVAERQSLACEEVTDRG